MMIVPALYLPAGQAAQLFFEIVDPGTCCNPSGQLSKLLRLTWQ